MPPPRPAFSAPDASYTASSYPVTAPPSPQYGGYGGYGVQPAVGHPGFAPAPKTNGMAIAAMVTSIVGLALLPCYGTGAVPGLVGAILGHVARKQIRERQESGGGMALAGVIMGWIATALGVVVVAGIVIFIAWAANQPTTGASYGTGFIAIGLVLASLS
ncbi:MAG: hypothetical protein QOE61_5093 [Micromonosporaceae bacterium]|nr:hypothetical protein [Micromonosporaceae bacterium]